MIIADAISIALPSGDRSSEQPSDRSGDDALVDAQPAADDGLPPWLLVVIIVGVALIIAGVITAIALRRRAASR